MEETDYGGIRSDDLVFPTESCLQVSEEEEEEPSLLREERQGLWILKVLCVGGWVGGEELYAGVVMEVGCRAVAGLEVL